MAEEKSWAELTDDEKDAQAESLLEEHGVELLKAKTLLLKEIQELTVRGAGPGMANYARCYALLNGTLTSVS